MTNSPRSILSLLDDGSRISSFRRGTLSISTIRSVCDACTPRAAQRRHRMFTCPQRSSVRSVYDLCIALVATKGRHVSFTHPLRSLYVRGLVVSTNSNCVVTEWVWMLGPHTVAAREGRAPSVRSWEHWNLGHKVGRGTIANILREHAVDPAPERGKCTRSRSSSRRMGAYRGHGVLHG